MASSGSHLNHDQDIINCYATELMDDCWGNEETTLLNWKHNQLVSADCSDMQGKCIAIYYSGIRFNNSKEVSDILAKKYVEINANDPKLEIVFIPADTQEEHSHQFFQHQPWKMVDHDNDYAINGFKDLFELKDEPALIIFSEDRRLLTIQGLTLFVENNVNDIKSYLLDTEVAVEDIPELQQVAIEFESVFLVNCSDSNEIDCCDGTVVRPKPIRYC